MRRFEGRVALVSGAAQGMGRAVAERLGQEGALVVAVDINGAGAEATAKAIGGKSFGLACDIGDEEAVGKLFGTVASRCGKLDVLVNNAAIVPFVKWDELTFKEWRRVLRVNLDGLYLMCRAGSDLMRKNNYGRIVNFSSNSIFAGTPNMAHYVASKGGVLTFTRALATELGGYKITVNSICPGVTRTELGQRNSVTRAAERGITVAEMQAEQERAIPIRRANTPEDIAALAVFLASPGARNITGQSINVDGGLVPS